MVLSSTGDGGQTSGEVGLLDGSSSSISLEDVNAFDGLRHELGAEVV